MVSIAAGSRVSVIWSVSGCTTSPNNAIALSFSVEISPSIVMDAFSMPL